MEMLPLLPVVLPNIDPVAERERLRQLGDRKKTMRLAQLIGGAMLLLGFLPLAWFFWEFGMSNALDALFPIGCVLALYLLPGITLIATGSLVRRGGRAAPIFVLATCAWTVLALLAMVMGIAWFVREERALVPLAMLVINLCVMAGVGKIIYHDIRVIAPAPQRRAAVWLGFIRLMEGIVALVVGAYCCWRSIDWVPKLADHPPAQIATTAPAPFSGDVYGPNGLPADERAAAIQGLSRQELDEESKAQLDAAFRHVGAKLFAKLPRPITAKAVAAIVEPVSSRSPPTMPHPDFQIRNGARLSFDQHISRTYLVITDAGTTDTVTAEGWYPGPGLSSMSFRAANLELNRINEDGRRGMTQAQANELVTLITRLTTSDYGQSRKSPPESPIGEYRWFPNGTLRIVFCREEIWLASDGSYVWDPDPPLVSWEERRALHAPAWAPGVLGVGGLLGLLTGAVMLWRGLRDRAIPRIVLPIAHIVGTVLIIVGIVAFYVTYTPFEPEFRTQKAFSESVRGLVFVGITWMGITGVVVPLGLRSGGAKLPQPVIRV